MTPTSTPWCADATLVRSLPPLFRWWARYVRLARNQRTGAVRGSSAVQRLCASLTRAFGLDTTAVVTIRGVRLAVDLTDLRLSEAIHEMWTDVPEIPILAAALGRGGTFLDVGANHGTYSMLLAPVVGPEGRVLAFEPQPELAALIRRSFSANSHGHAAVIEVGCSDGPGTVSFYRPVENSGSASMYRDSPGGPVRDTVTIRIDALDRLLANESLPGRLAMKLDVEGAEVATLRGAVRTLRAKRPLIVFEMNADSLHASGHTVADLAAALREAGYEEFSEIDNYPATQSLDDLRETPQRNLIVY